ncbi:MAG UNVERIFIED_CONTAM: hypothetical protein LVQ98_04900 [Rickettsiaceae bacterium]
MYCISIIAGKQTICTDPKILDILVTTAIEIIYNIPDADDAETFLERIAKIHHLALVK